MKKTLLALILCSLSFGIAKAQCVTTCSNYIAVPITFSTFAVSGTTVSGLFQPNSDDGQINVPIGFSFNYYCGTYTSVNICSNGFIQMDYGTPINFGNPPVVNATQLFPSPNVPNGLIALHMDDFDNTTATGGGSIIYSTVGTAPNRMFIVTYNMVPIWYNALTGLPSQPTYNTGQIVLYETSNLIEIHSGQLDQSPNLATQGIENTTGTAGVGVTGRNDALWTATADAYRFIPVTPMPPGAISGPAGPCVGVTRTYSISTVPTATAYGWNLPGGWQGTSTTTALSATVGIPGSLSVTASYTCGTSAPATLSVNTVAAPLVSYASAGPAVLCSGDTITIVPAGASTYTLNPGGFTSPPYIIIADTSTNFYLTGQDATSGCLSANVAQTYILVNPSPTITVNSGSICSGQSFTIGAAGADSYIYSTGFDIVSPTAPGTYTYSITGVNLNGCSSIPESISTVTVNANPTLTLTVPKPTICKYESTLITASGASTYSWGGPAAATTNTLATPNLTTTMAFTVTGTSAEGCSKVKSITISVSACTGIEEFSGADAGVEVYPNPATGIFNLKIQSVTNRVTITLYDATGRLVLTSETDKQDVSLDLTDRAKGLYYLKVKNGDALQTLKLVKE